MGVELHGVAHDVGHLVVAAVVHALHRVQDASLNGLQSVLDMGHGALQYHVGGVVEEPVLVHAAEVMHDRSVETVHRPIVGVFVGLQVVVLLRAVVQAVVCRMVCCGACFRLIVSAVVGRHVVFFGCKYAFIGQKVVRSAVLPASFLLFVVVLQILDIVVHRCHLLCALMRILTAKIRKTA